jgi:hypothetical protein
VFAVGKALYRVPNLDGRYELTGLYKTIRQIKLALAVGSQGMLSPAGSVKIVGSYKHRSCETEANHDLSSLPHGAVPYSESGLQRSG